MQESQRLAMLNAMGVKALHPRFVFSGAKASPKIHCDEPEALVTTDKVPAEKIDLSSITQATDNVDVQPVPPKAQMPKTNLGLSTEISKLADIKQGLESKTEAPAIKVRYRVFQLGSIMMLVEQPNVEFEYAQQAKKFFAQLYFFLSGSKDFTYSESQFDWPPSKSFPVASDKKEVRQACLGFLQGRAVEPYRWVFLWGQQFQPIFSESDMQLGEVLVEDDFKVIQLSAVSEYISNPQQKHLLWQYLQSVKKTIN